MKFSLKSSTRVRLDPAAHTRHHFLLKGERARVNPGSIPSSSFPCKNQFGSLWGLGVHPLLHIASLVGQLWATYGLLVHFPLLSHTHFPCMHHLTHIWIENDPGRVTEARHEAQRWVLHLTRRGFSRGLGVTPELEAQCSM
jgi:hypothetical protein